MKRSAPFHRIQGHTFYSPPLDSRSVILDLGANHGEFAKEMKARFGGNYYLVEPNPALAERLRAEEQFPVWQCALAATEGLIRFNIARNDEGSSILALPTSSIFDCILQNAVQVPARRLESLLKEIDAPRIDLIKMDIEGAEFMVLRELPVERLRTIAQITAEFHGDSVFGFNLHRDMENVINFLEENGFLFLDFSGQTRRDVLFINRAIHHIPAIRLAQWRLRRNPPAWLFGIWKRLPMLVQAKMRRCLK
jgi:FkbM family methyltransferase